MPLPGRGELKKAGGRDLPWCLLALLACAPAAFAASPAARPDAPAGDSRVEELSEVVVSGARPTGKLADVIPWLRRLLGQYTIEGYVDLGGTGAPAEQRAVRGTGVCVGFGVAPGVQCEFNIRWPETRAVGGAEILGGVSNLSPAMLLFGLEPDEVGLRYLQVDNRGLAEGSRGGIIGDTAVFRTPCADVTEGCERATRIITRSDSKLVELQVDTEIYYQAKVRYRFQLTRVADVQTVPGPGGGLTR
jgi:hypothetical protein